MEILPKEFVIDYDRNLLQELSVQKIMLDNRKLDDTPLRANEFTVEIPRERYETLVDLSIECLKQRIIKNDR